MTESSLSRPRIVFVTNIIPPYRKSFYEKLVANAAFDWLIVHGATPGEQGRQALERGLEQLPQHRVTNDERRMGPFTLRWQRGMLRAVFTARPTLVVALGMAGNVSNWLLLLGCRLRGIPVLLWACGWEPQVPNSLAWRIKQRIAGVYFRLADAVLVYSSKGARAIENLGVPSRNVQVCYNGIEIDHLLSTESQVLVDARDLRARHTRPGQRIVLFVGAMLADKRIDLILRAKQRMEAEGTDWALWLVGDGPEKAALERLAHELALRDVTFWGRKVQDVDQYFAAADLVVLPGIGGLALNQAMFWARPCIVSEADGTEEDLVLEQVTGKRFVSGDLDSLCATLRDCLARDPQTLQAWGDAGRQLIVERSNVTRMVETFITTLTRVLAER